jgi:phage terminase large subunit-like protein
MMSKVGDARDWLVELLADGPANATDVKQVAGAEGIAARTLERAATDDVVQKHQTSPSDPGGQRWVWELAPWARAGGGQRTEAFHLLSSLMLEDGRAWGAAAKRFQVEDAAAILAADGPSLHFLTRPRGASKTTDLAGVCIAALLTQLPPRGRAFAFAVDIDQAALLLDAVAGFVARTEGLSGALRVENWKVTSPNGATLAVKASDAASAWGLRGDLFVVDEFTQWPTTPGPRRLWEAILSAVPKVAGCRLVLLSTAGDPTHPSRKLLDQARTSAEWHVNETPGPCPWISEASLAEQRRLLAESSYQRLHLNRWAASEDRLVDPETLRECVTLDGWQPYRPGVSYVATLDMAYVNDQAVLAVCHRDGDRVILDRMHAWKGSRLRPIRERDVEETLLEAHRAFGRPRLLLDPWQTKGMAQRLRSQGVNVEEFTFSSQSVGRIALVLYRLLRDRAVELPDDEDLLTELARVQLRETAPGVYRLDHAHDEHDDRAVALAMAAQHLVARSASTGCGTSASGPPIPRRVPADAITTTYPWERAPWERVR